MLTYPSPNEKRKNKIISVFLKKMKNRKQHSYILISKLKKWKTIVQQSILQTEKWKINVCYVLVKMRNGKRGFRQIYFKTNKTVNILDICEFTCRLKKKCLSLSNNVWRKMGYILLFILSLSFFITKNKLRTFQTLRHLTNRLHKKSIEPLAMMLWWKHSKNPIDLFYKATSVPIFY